jgi:hypothetical protein
MSSIKKNVNLTDKTTQSNLAEKKVNQMRPRTKAYNPPEKEGLIAEEDITGFEEVEVTMSQSLDNMADRPVLVAQAHIVEVVDGAKPVSDKELSLMKDLPPPSLSDVSSLTVSAVAGAGGSALSWLPIAGGVGAVGVLAGSKSGGVLALKPDPGIESVAITSATGAQNNTLNVGDVVTVTVNMDAAVQVSGTPQLALTIGGAVVQANYASGSGSNQLVFSYTIQAGQTDGNGIAIAANALQLNGGSIRNTAGDAVLTHAAVADNANYMVDTTTPGISQMLIDVETVGGDVVHVRVDMTEVVNVSGTPQLAMNLGGVSVLANYVSGSGTNQLVFSYAVPLGQTYHNGVDIAANAFQLNGGALHDVAGNNAVLTHEALGLLDDGLPLITQIAITSATGAQNNTLNVGDVVTVTVNMDAAVQVSGTPQLALTIGGAVVQANYASGSGSNQLVFSYTIQAGQTDGNGIAIAANALQLNGGSIRNTAGDAVLTHAAVADNANYMVDTSAPTVTTTQATVTNTASISIQSTEIGMAYLVNSSVAVTSLANITSSADNLWNSVVIGAPNTATFLPTSGLIAGTYSVYAVDAAGNMAQASNSVTISSGSVAASPIQLSSITAGTGGFVINGEVANESMGYSVSWAGDVNGDGLDDLIMGAHWANPNGLSQAGKSYVVFGKSNGTAIDLSAVSGGTGGFVINGETAGDQLGYCVSGAGDVNGDGLADLIVGARLASGGAGKSYVVFGKRNNTDAINLSAIAAGTGGFVINGQSVSDASGVSVSGAGDVNGDGLADLIVGTYQADVNSLADAGKSYVVFGKRNGTAINLSAVESGTGGGFVINGHAVAENAGFNVSGAGDVNGDGMADLIVGAHGAAPGSLSQAGRTYVVFGKSASTAINLSAVAAGTGGFMINGEAGFDWSGISVSAAGDVNGDGLADLIVGAHGADPSSLAEAGKSYVVFGKNNGTAINLTDVAAGTGGFVINGQAPGENVGTRVSGAGDVNGDGLADLIVGAYYANTNTGKSYVVFGKSTGTVVNLSAIAAGNGGFVINGEATGDNSGVGVSAAGDVNGDGLADLIVGANGADPLGLNLAGRSYVIFGSTTGAFVQTAVDALGTSGDDSLNDAGVARTLAGGAGNDSLVATAASVLYGGMGDDNFSISSAMITALRSNYGAGGNINQLAQVGGGTGVDTLSLVGSGLTLDLTLIANQSGGYDKVASRLSSIEKIDLSGSGNNMLKLSVRDLLDMSGVNDLLGLSNFSERHQLVVSGNAGDQVELVGINSWNLTGSYTVGGVDYAAYNHSTSFATLFVQTGVTVL